jgi:hypothetical protein
MQIIKRVLYRRGGAYVQYCTAQNKSSSTIDNNIEQQTLDHASDPSSHLSQT